MAPRREVYLEAEARRREFLGLLSQGQSATEACETLGISPSSYRQWRTRDQMFAAECDSRLTGARRFKEDGPTWEGFMQFRKLFFGHDTPPHQAMMINAWEQTQPGDITLTLIWPAAGKSHPNTESIPRIRYGQGMNDIPTTSTTGPHWTTIGELRPGDFVYGRDGKPTKVLGVFPQGVRPIRRVHFSDNTHLDVSPEHLWLIRDRQVLRPIDGRMRRIEHVVDTDHIEANLLNAEGRGRISVPMTAALQYPDADLPMDPWLLGYWLGNGALGNGRITANNEDGPWVRDTLTRLGFEWTGKQYDRTVGSATTGTVIGLKDHLHALGILNTKRIPPLYLFSSVAQRELLLAGLLDSDGYAGAGGKIELCSTDKDLANDCEELIRSLGIKVGRAESDAAYKINGVRKITGRRHRLTWVDQQCRFTSPRKRAMFRPSPGSADRHLWKVVTKVEHLPDAPATCIQVEAEDRLYVSGRGLTLSHNTTLTEDFFCYKLALNPDYRIMVGCEAQGLSRRILGRVKNRMDPMGPFPRFVEQFGPFAPEQMTGRATSQTWAADAFNVAKRLQSDERDWSMSGIGFGSNIIGTRTDHLHCDDLQSTKTLNRTEQMVTTFQQDWLTRPGETGITTINGTRAGDGDFYEALIAEFEGESWFRVVKIPVVSRNHITGELEPTWPYDPNAAPGAKGHTMEMLDKIKRKVGPDVWSRSYMQDPRSSGLGTFNEDIVARCMNPGRSFHADNLPDSGPIYIGLDPAVGGVNCLMAFQVGQKMSLLDLQEDVGLQRNEDIMDRLEMMIIRLQARGGRVSDVVVEANNFQRGLARDERFKDLSDKYGFAMREHLTNINKYDSDIGVASMVTTFIKREFDIPYAADEITRDVADNFKHQLLRWRPGIKGNILRQDQVMATWFCWILWQSRRRTHPMTGTTFRSQGLPWAPTQTGLLLPAGSPFYGG